MTDHVDAVTATVFDIIRVHGTGAAARARVRAAIEDALLSVQQETLQEIRPPDEEPPASAGT
jgi:hypothetical protein